LLNFSLQATRVAPRPGGFDRRGALSQEQNGWRFVRPVQALAAWRIVRRNPDGRSWHWLGRRSCSKS